MLLFQFIHFLDYHISLLVLLKSQNFCFLKLNLNFINKLLNFFYLNFLVQRIRVCLVILFLNSFKTSHLTTAFQNFFFSYSYAFLFSTIFSPLHYSPIKNLAKCSKFNFSSLLINIHQNSEFLNNRDVKFYNEMSMKRLEFFPVYIS